MDDVDDYSIKKVAKGGALIFIGMTLSIAVFLFYKVMAARYLGPGNYGMLTLGITVMNIAALIGLAGMHHSIGKLVSHYLARKQHDRVKGVIATGFIITIGLSVALSIILYFLSDYISLKIFSMHGLGMVIRIFAFGVPFSVLAQLLKHYFFTFKKPEFAILSESVFEKLLNLAFLVVLISISASLTSISFFYVLSLVISTLVGFLLLYPLAKRILSSKIKLRLDFRGVLSFSTPLMLTGILSVALAWMDTLFIGVFKTNADVGIYNAAYTIASALIILLYSFGDIFYPITSELYSKKAEQQIKKIFETSSRWLFLMAFPLFVVIFAFPSSIIKLLFGESYTRAASSLSILVIGYFFITAFGLPEWGLRTFRKTKFLWIVTLIGFLLNILLNVTLIPVYGIAGAAVAATISIIFITLSRLIYFTRLIKFKFDKFLYFKFISAGLVAFAVVFYSLDFLGYWKKALFLPILLYYMLLYFAMLFAFKSFSDEDVSMLEAIERKTGIRLGIIKNLMRR